MAGRIQNGLGFAFPPHPPPPPSSLSTSTSESNMSTLRNSSQPNQITIPTMPDSPEFDTSTSGHPMARLVTESGPVSRLQNDYTLESAAASPTTLRPTTSFPPPRGAASILGGAPPPISAATSLPPSPQIPSSPRFNTVLPRSTRSSSPPSPRPTGSAFTSPTDTEFPDLVPPPPIPSQAIPNSPSPPAQSFRDHEPPTTTAAAHRLRAETISDHTHSSTLAPSPTATASTFASNSGRAPQTRGRSGTDAPRPQLSLGGVGGGGSNDRLGPERLGHRLKVRGGNVDFF
jgi:hypothetical protein